MEILSYYVICVYLCVAGPKFAAVLTERRFWINSKIHTSVDSNWGMCPVFARTRTVEEASLACP